MPRQHPQPARILVLASNPRNDLQLTREYDAIRQQLIRFPGKFNPQFSSTGRLSDLEDELLLFGPKFFHFCGHGEKDGRLLFQDSSLAPLAVTARRLGSLFQSSRCKPHCVVLNCCYSHTHARSIARHVPYAIGIDGAIGDGSAIDFSTLFYRSIIADYHVPEAFSMALTALADTPWSNLPKLFTQEEQREPADTAPKLPLVAPFDSRAAVDSVRNWILSERCHIVFLALPTLRSNSGDTNRAELADQVLAALQLEDKFAHILRVTIPRSASRTEVVQVLLNVLPKTRDISRPPAGLESLLACLTEHRYLLLIDNLDEHGSAFDTFRALAQEPHNSCLLVLGATSKLSLGAFQGIDTIKRINLSYPTTSNPWSAASAPVDSIVTTVRRASRASLLRAEEKLRARDERTIEPISRPDTQPHFPGFLNSDRPLLLLLGDSGTGKSTLFLQLYRTPPSDSLVLLYDAHHIEEQQSLTHAITHDFRRPDYELDDLLDDLHVALTRSSQKLLILIDGLNESRTLRRSTLRTELERLSSRLPSTVKIACSCRKVYWDVFLAHLAPLPRHLYFGSRGFILERFSEREAAAAFIAYARIFDLRSAFASLSHELKERLRDPLMLRLCAEGYRSKELPHFAPAVLIFSEYDKQLRQRLGDTILPAFLDALIAYKAQDTASTQSSDLFDVARLRRSSQLRTLMQLQAASGDSSSSPLLLLEDEGILTAVNAERTTYRFAFDRFFEFLLGKVLCPILQRAQGDAFVDALTATIMKLSPLHYSYIQALKAELIRLNIDNPRGSWSLYSQSILRKLLNSNQPEVIRFTRDLLRELAFEGADDLVAVISELYPDKSQTRLLILDIAPDSTKALPLALTELLTGSAQIARRCCRILAEGLRDPNKAEMIENSLLDSICISPLTHRSATGLVYYTASIFVAAHALDLDPFPAAKRFWVNAWAVLRGRDNARAVLTAALAEVIRTESPLFFGESAGEGIDYFWNSLAGEEKALALEFVPYIENPTLPLSLKVQEVMLFFGSSIRTWADRANPELAQATCYKIEYRLSQWLLIQRAHSSYKQVRDILGTYIATNSYKSIDFSLGVMELCCLIQLRGTAALKDAYSAMLDWTERIKRNEHQFYWCLTQPDPLAANQCPPDMVGRVSLLDEFSPSASTVPFLEQWLISSDLRDVQMGIIAARNMWSFSPAKVLGTLDLVAHHDDPVCSDWLERLLREVYLIYPRLVEDFFARNQFTAERIVLTKHRPGVIDPSAAEHPGHLLMIPLLLGPSSRLAEVARWYRRLHEAKNLEAFVAELLDVLLAIVASDSPS